MEEFPGSKSVGRIPDRFQAPARPADPRVCATIAGMRSYTRPRPPPNVEPRERAARPLTSADPRNLERTVDQLRQALTKLVDGLADP